MVVMLRHLLILQYSIVTYGFMEDREIMININQNYSQFYSGTTKTDSGAPLSKTDADRSIAKAIV